MEPAFREWFEMNTTVKYDQLMILYPLYYSMRNRIPLDSLELPAVYHEVTDPANFFNDKYTVSRDYLYNLGYYASTSMSQPGIGMKEKVRQKGLYAEENIYKGVRSEAAGLMPPRTRDYFLANTIIEDLGFALADSVAIAEFRRTATDTVAINAAEKKLAKYFEKEALIGRPLNAAFRETQLRDTADVALTFGEMINLYKGKVVYLDIWDLSCGPCIAEMPNSRALKEKLAGEPVAFVYLTHNDNFDGMWQQAFDKTFTTENHYRLEKSFKSEMLQFLEIDWVPCYMIFDREGKLVSYTADSPGAMEQQLLELL